MPGEWDELGGHRQQAWVCQGLGKVSALGSTGLHRGRGNVQWGCPTSCNS